MVQAPVWQACGHEFNPWYHKKNKQIYRDRRWACHRIVRKGEWLSVGMVLLFCEDENIWKLVWSAPLIIILLNKIIKRLFFSSLLSWLVLNAQVPAILLSHPPKQLRLQACGITLEVLPLDDVHAYICYWNYMLLLVAHLPKWTFDLPFLKHEVLLYGSAHIEPHDFSFLSHLSNWPYRRVPACRATFCLLRLLFQSCVYYV